MKPLQLRIEAFGPYADPVEIGFDALSREGLFLIHGSTGAGKTFLLDALCFALYGEVSGDRALKGLKSDHAAPAAVPRVSLAFSCGSGCYRVVRSPAYTAPRTRGQGTIDKAATAHLQRLDPSGGEPLTVASRTTDVTREVESLVGLSATQFRQVILLPQGRFAEVLRARAEERELLLKTLFDTVLYERAGSWLEEQAKAARIALSEQTCNQEQLMLLALRAWRPHAQEPAADGPAAGEETATDPVQLDQLELNIAAVVRQAGADLDQASAALRAAQTARTSLERLAERWDRRAAATARLQEQEAKQAVVAEFRLRLQRALQAEGLRASLAEERSAAAELALLQADLPRQLDRLHRARERASGLPASVLELELGSLPDREALTSASRDLAVRRSELQNLMRLADQVRQAEQRAVVAQALVAEAEGRQSAGRTALASREQRRRQDADALARASSARDQLDGLQRAADAAAALATAAAAVEAARCASMAAFAEQQRSDQASQRARERLLALRHRQISGMAAALASGLEHGVACPVCGSLEHPRLASALEAPVAEQDVTAAESTLFAAERSARDAATAAATAALRLQTLIEQAGSAAAPEQAAAAAQQAEARLRQAQALAAEVPRLQAAAADHEQELQGLQAALQTAASEQARQGQVVRDALDQAHRLRAVIVQELGEGLDPQAVQQGLEPLELALAQLAQDGEAQRRVQTRLDLAGLRLVADLASAGFADAEEAQAALRQESTRLKWAERIDAYERELIALRAQLADPALLDLPPQRPDTAAADAAVLRADLARTTALERHGAARLAQQEIARVAEEHRQGEQLLAERRERAQLLSGLADRCTGRAAPYVSLQRWVLSAHLADICRHANQRLELMTSGRYQLTLSDEGGRGGRQAGLALRVLDAYTGEQREVSSLSGGETFQASLALALGVADTVQARSGGVQLEALFIDEGFGSLDPDNLQLAMDELDRLREGGRMIGIISHVAGLRERIRSGIEVRASDRGSTARVLHTAMP